MAVRWIVGIDEVGRGPLAGPVCVCAVAMPATAYNKMCWNIGGTNGIKKGTRNGIRLTDSKKMNAQSREAWERHARALLSAENGTQALRIGISMRPAAMIDRRGISTCIRVCIASSIKQLKLDPAACTVLLDGGLKAPKEYAKQQTVIRGDSAHPIISLASVVAKVRRDNHMRKLHLQHPHYAWDENKGYGTRAHRTAIRKHGSTPIHRKSFISKVF